MYCPNCGTRIDDGCRYCPSCGAEVHPGAPQDNPGCYVSASAIALQKSEALCIILSVIITGAGHMYIGKMKEGVTLLLLQVALWFAVGILIVLAGSSTSVNTPMVLIIAMSVLALLSFIIWLYAIVDSDKKLREYNAEVLMGGQPPW